MTKIKLCGMFRFQDIDYVNEAKPDYCGFIVEVPSSHRNVSIQTLRCLRARLDPNILPVGVFVNAPQEQIISLVRDGTISLVQLHGTEDEKYISALRQEIFVPIIQAFRVAGPEDVLLAEQSNADHILLDNGSGGTGQRFDWTNIQGLRRPYILAGGLNPQNISEALKQLHPWGIDLSGGLETDRLKDREKILAAVHAVREGDGG